MSREEGNQSFHTTEKKLPVKSLSITKHGDTTTLHINYLYDNYLHYVERIMQLSTIKDTFHYYSIQGTEKIIFKDTFNYTINLVIDK